MFTRNFKIFEWAVAVKSLLLLSTAYAFSAEIPQLKTYVTDYANVLPENYKHNLNERLHNFEVTSPGHAQVLVVIVQNTGDESIEEFANKTFHQNKLGHSDNNNGVLTVVSMDHKMRIEVGYDLEPTLTDSKSSDILNIMKPSLKAGNFPKAFDDEMGQLLPIVSAGSSENAKPAVSNNTPQVTNQHSSTSKGFPFMTLLFFIFLGVVAFVLYRKFRNIPTVDTNSYRDTTTPYVDPTSTTSTYVPPASPNYSRSQPSYNPNRSTVYSRPGPFSPPVYDYDPPAPAPYTPPKDHSVLKSAAAGAVGGFVASELLNSGSNSRRDDDTPSYTPSTSYNSDPSPSYTPSDTSYDPGAGDSGGGGASSDW